MEAYNLNQSVSDDAVLTKAFLKMAGLLALNQKQIAMILGISEASVSRLQQGGRMLNPESKEGELAIFMLRLYRGLSAILGGDDKKIQAWLEAYNRYFEASPIDLIASIQGMVAVTEYVDAMRGKL